MSARTRRPRSGDAAAVWWLTALVGTLVGCGQGSEASDGGAPTGGGRSAAGGQSGGLTSGGVAGGVTSGGSAGVGGGATSGGVTSGGSAAPQLVDSRLVAQKEGQGTQTVVTTLGTGAAGLTLISIDAVLTALFPGPPSLNNGNVFGAALLTEVYTPNYPQYSLRVYRANNVMGGAPHSSTLTKSMGFSQEATKALLAFSTSSSVVQSSVVRPPAGAGALLTSAPFTITGGPARCLAIWSGSGDVNPVAPTATITAPATWGAPVHSVAYGSADAPNGHIPLTLWTAVLPAGTHTWSARPAIDEGGIMATICLR